MKRYTILTRRKSDGRWTWVGTTDESMMNPEVSKDYSVVKLPNNFLFGRKVRARTWDLGGDIWFYVPNSRDAIVRDE